MHTENTAGASMLGDCYQDKVEVDQEQLRRWEQQKHESMMMEWVDVLQRADEIKKNPEKMLMLRNWVRQKRDELSLLLDL